MNFPIVKMPAQFRFLSAFLLLAAALSAQSLKLARPDHIVVVVEENRSYPQVIGASTAPYINQLAGEGALLTNFHGVRHPSEPNYVAMFAGSTFGLDDDHCLDHKPKFTAPNLASELMAKHLTFQVYADSLPHAGEPGCILGRYVRKHNPAIDFSNVPASVNVPFTEFPSDFSKLPTVAYVIPNLDHDMHDGSIAEGDQWLKANLSRYADWARTHHSLLVVTWDESSSTSSTNWIPTFIVGGGVHPGLYNQYMDHYSLLRTIENLYGLSHAGHSAQAQPLAEGWLNRQAKTSR